MHTAKQKDFGYCIEKKWYPKVFYMDFILWVRLGEFMCSERSEGYFFDFMNLSGFLHGKALL